MAQALRQIEDITEDFQFIDDWEDRYRYVIELGRSLPPLADEDRSPDNKVQGCVSQVWLARHLSTGSDGTPILTYTGDSDAHIVRGLIAILFGLYSGKSPRTILDADAQAIFNDLGLEEHLTPQRSNGLHAMVERIRGDAADALNLV